MSKENKFTRIQEPNSYFRQQFLLGNPNAINYLGQVFLTTNGMPPLCGDNKINFLLGDAKYLGEIGKEEWGMATEDAIRCLFDVNRTAAFIKGIDQTIMDMSGRLEPLEVIEAGGGTGILAIAAALSGIERGKNIHVTILEINPETAQETQNFIEHLGLNNNIDVVIADATTYVPTKKIDIIISECLSTGVFNEPQVQIMQHLRKFITKDGKLVPQGVSLQHALANAIWEQIENGSHEAGIRDFKGEIILGKLTAWEYINFYETTAYEDISFTIPPASFVPTAIVTRMRVHVTENIALEPDDAYFLGTTRFDKILPSRRNVTYAGSYPPGGTFPQVIEIDNYEN